MLAIIARLGVGGGTGHVIEYLGEAVRALSMEGRMTLCNMSIEAGARAGMVAPDEVTFAWLKGRPRAPQGKAWDEAVARWRALPSDPGARYDRELTIDASTLSPMITWGTNPGQAIPVTACVPDPATAADAAARASLQGALGYMGLRAGQPILGQPVDVVFVGSCTNGRLEDLREAAGVLRGRRVKARTLIVPGSQRVKRQAEAEGLDRVFREAGRRVAGAGLLDVHRHERRPHRAGPVLRLHLQPELRGPAGGGRPDAAGQPGHGGGGGGGRRGGRSQVLRGGQAVNPIRVIESRTVVLPRENIDTDQIIPARFLKVTDKAGLGKAAFADWRYGPDGSPRPDFVLNRPEAQGCAGAGGRRQLRLRLVARARPVGAPRPRLPRRALHPHRRHLQEQRAQERAAPHRGRRRQPRRAAGQPRGHGPDRPGDADS